ncbi:hypothetical protein WT83_16525 [Burkholderia territorii]|uniref:Uncharacterized protein n=1 Tax=Burkholderia territorii TaxID=1503055 RepID=A0A108EP66_9BURK|nr:hypothetical protein WT83_16525 [Burkholderia territorii]
MSKRTEYHQPLLLRSQCSASRQPCILDCVANDAIDVKSGRIRDTKCLDRLIAEHMTDNLLYLDHSLLMTGAFICI